MASSDYMLVSSNREPLKMPKRDWFKLGGHLTKIIEGSLFVLSRSQGKDAFVPVVLI